MKLTHGSLFSGIGGFDLAAEWAGWENIFHCEWNPFGQQVLKHHFPNSISYHDITKTDFSIHRGRIDVLTGGFPCQPYSTAGKRLGKADERHLFPEMLRAIKEIQPRWIVGENVRGLISWNGGLVFHEVCDDLEREGYEVQPFLIPAASVNAPHQRYRVWFVAFNSKSERNSSISEIFKGQNDESIGVRSNATDSNSSNEKDNSGSNTRKTKKVGRKSKGDVYGELSSDGLASNSENNGHRGGESEQCANGERKLLQNEQGWSEVGGETEGCSRERIIEQPRNWDNFPTQSPICGGDDGLPKELDSITFPKWRNESIKAYGNAIVPQVALQIFKAINEMEK